MAAERDPAKGGSKGNIGAYQDDRAFVVRANEEGVPKGTWEKRGGKGRPKTSVFWPDNVEYSQAVCTEETKRIYDQQQQQVRWTTFRSPPPLTHPCGPFAHLER